MRHELSKIVRKIVQPLRPPDIPLWKRLIILFVSQCCNRSAPKVIYPPNPASHLLALEDVIGPKPSGIYKGDDLGQLVSESAIINTSLSGKSDNPSPLQQYPLIVFGVPLKKYSVNAQRATRD